MPTQSLTLKLPLLDLNQVKRETFERLEAVNTALANGILKMDKAARKGLTTKDFSDVPIQSGFLNQTLRNCKAKTKVKRFKKLPLETNNQGWKLHKVGNTFSVSFNVTRERSQRVPLKVHCASHRELLEKLLKPAGVKQGTLKLVCSKRGIWYVLLSLTLEVPEVTDTGRAVGVDRGQNVLAVAVTPEGRAKFFKAGHVKDLRRRYQKLRGELQAAGKHKAVKKLEQRERRRMGYVNHCISKEIVAFAKQHGCAIIFEDLSGIRNAPQSKKVKSDAGHNRDAWAYYDLELKAQYKAALEGVGFGKRPPHYTSQTCSHCGRLNKRDGHTYRCKYCGKTYHSDWNAGRNLALWDGRTCPLELDVSAGGLHGTAPNPVSQPSLFEMQGENGNLPSIASA